MVLAHEATINSSETLVNTTTAKRFEVAMVELSLALWRRLDKASAARLVITRFVSDLNVKHSQGTYPSLPNPFLPNRVLVSF